MSNVNFININGVWCYFFLKNTIFPFIFFHISLQYCICSVTGEQNDFETLGKNKHYKQNKH